MTTLADLGEDAITSQFILPRFPHVAEPGFAPDDCAIINGGSGGTLVHTIDPGPTPVVCELFHEDSFHLGWLSVTVNASDIAAMGAAPEHMLLAIEAPEDMTTSDLTRLLDGVVAAAEDIGVVISGGNLREAPQLRTQIAMIGRVHKGEPMRKGAGRAGQSLWAVGRSGHFWLSVLTALREGVDAASPQAKEALFRPMPKSGFGLGLQASGISKTATDASDGVMAAVEAIAAAAGCGLIVDLEEVEVDAWASSRAAALGVDPLVCAFAWGDWQIVTSVDPNREADLLALVEANDLHAMRCGRLVEGEGVCYRRAGCQISPPDLRSKKFSRAHAGWRYRDWAKFIESARMD